MLKFDDDEEEKKIEVVDENVRRVKVDDKRVINCQADVNQLMPLKYHWAWEKYLDACANHWMPQEINMAKDVALWKDPNGLTEDERLIVKRNLGFFVTADSLAANNIVLGTYRHITNPECRQYLLRQGFEEVVHCYIDGTMILTEDGFVDFKMLTKDTKVAQYHENGVISFTVPDEILHDRYTGDMYRFHNKARTYESIVTPQHRCVVMEKDDNPYDKVKIVLAEDLKIKNYNVPVTGFVMGKKTTLEHIERFRIAYQMEAEADNVVVIENGTDKKNIHMYFVEQHKIDRLREICASLGWTVTTKINTDKKSSHYEYSLCNIELPSSTTLYNSYRWINISRLDSRWCEEFMEELQCWGKYIKFPEGNWVTSTNLETCNKITLIALLCGKVATTYKLKETTIEERSYNLHILDATKVSGSDITKSTIHYDGLVHCVGVPTGMIITKYNDCVTVSGNTHAYQYISESLGLDEGEIFNSYKEVKSIREKDEFLIPFIDTLCNPHFKTGTFETDQQLLKSIMIFALVMEGLFFFCGFVQILALARQNKMTATAEQYALIMKDETNHCNFGVDLINQIKLENPRLWTEEFKKEMVELLLKGLELEYAYAEETMPRGVLGLNAPMFKEYLRYILNRRSVQVGLDPLFPGSTNPFPWMGEIMDLKKERNFFNFGDLTE